MKSLFAWFLLVSLLPMRLVAGEQPDWADFFGPFAERGTLVVDDRRQGKQQLLVYNPTRAAQRFAPASTFKIPHTLFALDAGLVRDEFQVFPWDGIQRAFPGHNADQNLRSAMRVSAVWLYERFARELGEEKAADYLKRIDYGNADAHAEAGLYWLDGKLAISALDQVEFLQRLYRNELPFAEAHQRLVKDILINEAGRDWILRAKTGWDGRIGWWVGWVEWPEGPVFFALNIDTPARLDDLPWRERIVRDVLRSIDALPGLPE